MSALEIIIGLTIMPLIMIIIGLLWKNHYPKSINWIYGYRTTLAMKNQQTWEFAHKHLANLWLKLGIALTFVYIILFVLFRQFVSSGTTEKLIGIWMQAQLILLIVSIVPTEIALRRNFDKDGNPK